MKVLIIGNGFDLAHGLETKYSDFLRYCKQKTISKLPQDNTLRKSLENNFWLSHFLMRSIDIGNTWIDFEDEILSAVVNVSRLVDAKWMVFPRFFAFNSTNGSQTSYKLIQKRTEIQTFYHEKKSCISSVIDSSLELLSEDYTSWTQVINDANSNGKGYCGFSCNNMIAVLFKNKEGAVNYIYDELRRFVKALEYYLISINYQAPRILYTIREGIRLNSVISFNYTKTFENLYSDYSRNIIYLHGSISSVDKKERLSCNMVLGTRSFENTDIIEDCFSIFQKFHQRQRYNNINAYQALLRHTDLADNRNNWIGITGHSLNSADRYLINNILTASNKTQITVYYHDETSKICLIDNIYALLGEKDAERRVHFIHQHDRENGLLIPKN